MEMHESPLLCDKDIVCLAGYRWEGMIGPPNSMMKVFATRNRVLYFEPPMPFIPIGYNYSWSNLYEWRKKSEEVADNLYLSLTPPLLPGKRALRLINRIEQKRLAAFVKERIRNLGFRDYILLAYYPHSADILDFLDYRIAGYMCGDEIAGQKYGRDTVMLKMDADLISKADFTVVVSEELYKTKKRLHKDVYVVTNGADYEHFSKALGTKEVPSELRNLNRPLVGFLGAVDNRINQQLVIHAAKQLPDWGFIFVGPISINTRALREAGNIYFLDKKLFSELPYYLACFDICIIPYILNAMTRNCFPLKLFEYFSAGKPVVTSPLPAVQKYEGLLGIAGTEEEFVSQIIHFGLHDSSEDKMRRVKIAEDNSWKNKAVELTRIIRRHL